MITPENITDFGFKYFDAEQREQYQWETYILGELKVRFCYVDYVLTESEILIDNHDPQRLTATVLVQLIDIFKN
jgi:hypothetical protein